MQILVVLALVSAAFAASVDLPADPYPNAQRIVGGTLTDISQWPEMASLLFSWATTGHRQSCGGSILNQRSILTAAHCFEYGNANWMWQARVGSTFANSGGVVFTAEQLIMHNSYNTVARYYADVAIFRVSGTISYNNNIQPASIAGANYNVADNQVVWATGWGRTSVNGAVSEQLRQVQIWTINQATCRTRYATRGWAVTDNMLCSGWLDVGGRDQCQGDSGGPLFHNRVVVGVCSWGIGCADAFLPGVNARVSSLSSWIQSNA